MCVDPRFGPTIYSLHLKDREIFSSGYPKRTDFGDLWTWLGGFSIVGCLARDEMIDSFYEVGLTEKVEMYEISSFLEGKKVKGILMETSLKRISGLKSVYLKSFYFLLPKELLVISQFQSPFALPYYFRTAIYFKTYSDVYMASDLVNKKIPIQNEHVVIPAEKNINVILGRTKVKYKYLQTCKVRHSLAITNITQKKGLYITLDIKSYLYPSEFILQHLLFNEIRE